MKIQTELRTIPLDLLVNNTGQVEGVHANPRFIKDKYYRRLKRSLQKSDLTDIIPLKVLPIEDGKFMTIGGNMRLHALQELGVKETRCVVIPKDTPAEVLNKAIILDNSTYGEWDFDMLANEWTGEPLEEWGVEMPVWSSEEEQGEGKQEKIEEAEELLNKAQVQNITEYIDQLDQSMQFGWLCTGLTRGLAKMKFLRALYYGEKYPQKMAFVYAPEIYYHRRGGEDYYSRLCKIRDGEICGIAGFRTMCSDGSLTKSIGSSYSVGGGGGGGGGDFPSNLAKKIYSENAGGGRVLDPCHGWGGRLVGAMLAGVGEYVGIDPSPIAQRAVSNIYTDFGEYVQTKARFISKPYEDVKDEELGGLFDCALTSPPYFDVEQYEGEDTSTERYSNFELWCERFYEPLIVSTIGRLKEGGSFFLQVGSQTYPLAQRAREICEKNDLRCELYMDDISFSTLGTEDRTDKEVVLKITAKI